MPLKLCMRPQLLGLFLIASSMEPRLLTEFQSGEIIHTERICEGTLETMDIPFVIGIPSAFLHLLLSKL